MFSRNPLGPIRVHLVLSAVKKPSSHPLHLLNNLPRIRRMSGPKLIQPSIQPLSRIHHHLDLNPELLRDLFPLDPRLVAESASQIAYWNFAGCWALAFGSYHYSLSLMSQPTPVPRDSATPLPR